MNEVRRFVEQFRSRGKDPSVVDAELSCSYIEMYEQVERWHDLFRDSNVIPGSVIGLRADYSASAIAALLALISRGAVAALIPRSQESFEYLKNAHACASLEIDVSGDFAWQYFDRGMSHPLLDRLRESGEGGLVLFTSGSTGRPKAALQSATRFLNKYRSPGRRFRTLAFLLFDHIAGLDTLFYTLAAGGTLVLTRRRNPTAILDAIEKYEVEVLPTSPTFLRMLCAAKTDGVYDVRTLKVITYGSEPMDSYTLARVRERFPKVEILQKYGTTETGSPRSQTRGDGSLWLKFKDQHLERKVIDDVLWIRGEGVMLGYLNCESSVGADGWFCTGDLVEVDGEWLRFRGKATETINVGGQKVTPSEVEESILELDFVRQALVSGEPHALMGQIVTARVTLATDRMAPADAVQLIRMHCRQRLAPYKVPVKLEVRETDLFTERQKATRSHAKNSSLSGGGHPAIDS